jgi:hypothetical protein
MGHFAPSWTSYTLHLDEAMQRCDIAASSKNTKDDTKPAPWQINPKTIFFNQTQSMKSKSILFLFALALILSACNREDQIKPDNNPSLAASTNILVEGEDANLIVENIELIRSNLDLLSRAVVGLAKDPEFVEYVATPIRQEEKVGNFSVPLGQLISTGGTNSTLIPSYLDAMEASVSNLGGSSADVAAVPSIAAAFEVADQMVYTKLTVSFLGAFASATMEERAGLDITPDYIAISQSYSPGDLPALQITESGANPVLMPASDIHTANVWYVGIAEAGAFEQSSGLNFRLKAQGEECSCTVAMSGLCIEEASNGGSKVKCGTTNHNCDCPNDCSGAGSY